MSTLIRSREVFNRLVGEVRRLSLIVNPHGDAEIDQRLAEIEDRTVPAAAGMVAIQIIDSAWLNDTLAELLNSTEAV